MLLPNNLQARQSGSSRRSLEGGFRTVRSMVGMRATITITKERDRSLLLAAASSLGEGQRILRQARKTEGDVHDFRGTSPMLSSSYIISSCCHACFRLLHYNLLPKLWFLFCGRPPMPCILLSGGKLLLQSSDGWAQRSARFVFVLFSTAFVGLPAHRAWR